MRYYEIVILLILMVANNLVYYRFGQRKGFKVGADFVIKTMEELTKQPLDNSPVPNRKNQM